MLKINVGTVVCIPSCCAIKTSYKQRACNINEINYSSILGNGMIFWKAMM
jgi:hypothetical protein